MSAAHIAHWWMFPDTGYRVLSGIGVEIHWAILQYVLGLPFMVFIALLFYLRTKDETWKRIARTLTKGFIIVFAVGAATGTLVEFGLVLLWPRFVEIGGATGVYAPFYLEIFAFLWEVVFLYMLWYGWDKFSPRALAAIALLGFIGPWYSAAMILSVNSTMTAPYGIMPAYIPNGTYLYSQGYPKVALYIPDDLVRLLNITALEGVHVSVLGATKGAVKVAIPAKILTRLMWEYFHGVKLKNSILVHFINKTTVQHLTMSQVKELASKLGVPISSLSLAGTKATPIQLLLNVPVYNILNYIIQVWMRHVGIMSFALKSPVYIPTLMHTIGAGLTVTGFTVMAAYALRLLKMPENADPEYRRYIEKAFKFAAVFAAIVIAYQGFIAGHEMGRAVAHWEPEKFAAMEATTKYAFSFSRFLHTDKIMPLLAYGSLHAKLPSYDKIPLNYCKLGNIPNIPDCRPPIVVDYIYYTKIGLALAIGIYALIVALIVIRDKWSFIDKVLSAIGIKGGTIPSRTWLMLAPLAAAIAQTVSIMGWIVRETGRLPWLIYGVMTVGEGFTPNPVSSWVLVLIALFFLAIAGGLVYTAYRVLWTPGRPGTESH